MHPEEDKNVTDPNPLPEESSPAPEKPKKTGKKAAMAKDSESSQTASLKGKKEKKAKAEETAAPETEGKTEGKKKEKTAVPAMPPGYVPRLQQFYREKVIPELMKKFHYKNAMMVPRLEKIVLNVGIGEASQNPKLLESAVKELAAITGLKPAVTRARLSISNFKLRKGMAVGCRVTLRRFHMYEFLDRFLNIAIPRIRDFRGLSDRSFDGRGSFSIGIKEQIIFPEIDIDKIERVHGLDITMVTTAKTDEEAQALLQAMGIPFRRHGGEGQDVAAA